MSTALIKAARLKPEVRLGQAISQFQADLSTLQKAQFRSHQSRASKLPPDIRDVMQLTAEINGSGGQCYGTRVTSFLQAVQQFAALGDIVVGGTQNLLACGVWALVRMTLLGVVQYSSYFERLSLTIMSVGRSAPRYQAMGAIYPTSKVLKSSLVEYFIVVVQLCHHVLRLSRKSVLGQWASTLTDSAINGFQADLELWATSIKEEVEFRMAEQLALESQERNWFRSHIARRSDLEAHSEEVRVRQRVLDSCSTYDHESSWKQIRKLGNVSFLQASDTYTGWRDRGQSGTLMSTGKLGSGKSVVLANIIDDLSLRGARNRATTYFFPQHDVSESLTARAVIGSLARQLLHLHNTDPGQFSDLVPDSKCLTLDALMRLLERLVPSTYCAYFVLDGLEHCDSEERKSILTSLRAIQKMMSLSVCISTRLESLDILEDVSDNLLDLSWLPMPTDNPDIVEFVNTELKRCVESGKLLVNDPLLVLEIQERLSQGAQGMFLWVALQIKALCLEHTDADIRTAIAHLPKSLSDIYSIILEKSRTKGGIYHRRILEVVIAARRPLTLDEMREALSVTPGDIVWDPRRIINNVHLVVASCGDLLTVDEEDKCLRMVHHSVKTFLLSDYRSNEPISLPAAQQRLDEIVLTYMNYEVFSNQISSQRTPQIPAGSVTSSVINSVASSFGGQALETALQILNTKKRQNQDIGHTLMNALKQRNHDQILTPLDFHDYANVWWPSHVRGPAASNAITLNHLRRILRLVDVNMLDGNGRTALSHAAERGDLEVLDILLEHGAADSPDARGTTSLIWAVEKRHVPIVRSLLRANTRYVNSVDSLGRAPLLLAILTRDVAVVEALICYPQVVVTEPGSDGELPFRWAVRNNLTDIVRALLESDKPVLESTQKDGDTVLHTAAEHSGGDIVNLLINYRIKVNRLNAKGQTPLWVAAAHGNHSATLAIYAHLNVHPELQDSSHKRTPLWIAAANGHTDVVDALIARNNPFMNCQSDDGSTALLVAACNGHTGVVKSLTKQPMTTLDYDDIPEYILHFLEELRFGSIFTQRTQFPFEDISRAVSAFSNNHLNKCNSKGATPLWIAVYNGHADVVDILLRCEGIETDSSGLSRSSLAVSCASLCPEVVRVLDHYGVAVRGSRSSDYASRPPATIPGGEPGFWNR